MYALFVQDFNGKKVFQILFI